MFKLFISKEENLFNKLTKDSSFPVSKEIINEIKHIETNLILSQKFTDIIFTKLSKMPNLSFSPNQYFRLLTGLMTLIKCDPTNSFVLQCITSSIQLILTIPQTYSYDEEKELMVSFANHLDFCISFASEDFSTLNSHLTLEDLTTEQTEEECENKLLNLILMFKNLTIIHWNCNQLYTNKLYIQVLSILYREMLTIFYRICLYLFLAIQKALENEKENQNKMIRILKLFDECQSTLNEILSENLVKQNLSIVNGFNVEMTENIQQLLIKRYKYHQSNSSLTFIASNMSPLSHLSSISNRSSNTNSTSSSRSISPNVSTLSPNLNFTNNGLNTTSSNNMNNSNNSNNNFNEMNQFDYETISTELKQSIQSYMNYLITLMNHIHRDTNISFESSPIDSAEKINIVTRFVTPDLHFIDEINSRESPSNNSENSNDLLNVEILQENDEIDQNDNSVQSRQSLTLHVTVKPNPKTRRISVY